MSFFIRYLLFLTLLCLNNVFIVSASADTKYISPNEVYKILKPLFEDEFKNKYIYYYGLASINKSIHEGKSVPRDLQIGTIGDPRELIPKKHRRVVTEAERLYSDNNYVESAAIIKATYNSDTNNLYIANTYARALYKFDREASFIVYSKLVHTMDNAFNGLTSNPAIARIKPKQDKENTIVIHVRFPEAYWKLGTLYLDRNEWDNAVYEIARCLAASYPSIEVRDLEQALGFLCEAYAALGNHNKSLYYASKALSLNPENTYVRPFLVQSLDYGK